MDYRAKYHYQNYSIANKYDSDRFTSFHGKIENWLEKRILKKLDLKSSK